jgi:hypothetical protein
MKLLLSALLLFVSGVTFMQAQEAIPASGGNASGTGGSASYTVGQVGYTTNTGTNGSVTQGVQQPFEISVVNGIKEAKDILLECSAYPNPTKDFLTLKVENFDIKNLTYQLFDITGKLVENKIIQGNLTSITMNNLAASTYLLKVMQSSTEVKTFKIVKN